MFAAVYLPKTNPVVSRKLQGVAQEIRRTKRTVKSDDAEDEDQRQNQDNNGVDLEAGALVGVKTEHGAARATGASSARAVGAGIGNLLLLVGSSTATDGGTSTARGRRRGGARRANTGSAASGRGAGRRGTRRILVEVAPLAMLQYHVFHNSIGK